MSASSAEHHPVVIVGAGIASVGMAIRLLEIVKGSDPLTIASGEEDFVVCERNG